MSMLRTHGGGTPLYSVGSVQKAKMLIEHGADVNAGNSSGFTALFVTRNLEVAQFLIDHGADVKGRSATSSTPLHVPRGPEITQLLIDHGADVNARDKFGVTPLASVEQRLQVTRGQAGEPYRQSAAVLRKHGATK